MDWWSTSLQLVQKHAQEAAEQASVLARHASLRAAEVAQQASVTAAAVAKEASVKASEVAQHASQKVKATAEEAHTKLQQLTVKGTYKQVNMSTHDDDLIMYGLNQELIGFLSSLTYSTFSDFPVDTLLTAPSGSQPSAAHKPPSYKLNPWQEKHASLALKEVQQLHDLRFVLCPRRMDEDMFWLIYFALVKRYLPADAWGGRPADSGEGAAEGAGQSTLSKGLALDTKGVAKRDSDSDISAALIDDAQLEELENDPELAAYLTEALADTNPDMESDVEGGDVDLDDYINQLDEEANADKV